MLSSTIIDHLRQLQQDASGPRNSHILLYFYFDFTDSRKQSLESAIRSLISQLYYEQPQSKKHLDLLWLLRKDGRQQPSTQDLTSTFQKILEDAGDIWIILDALDKCKIRDGQPLPGLLNWLENLHLGQPNVRLLVTSRPEDDIRLKISDFAKKECSIYLGSDLIAEDINNFIHEQVKGGRDFHRWHKHPNIQKEIEYTLREKSNGM